MRRDTYLYGADLPDGVKFTPGLPSLTGAQRQFAPLPRRKPGGPPPPWDGAALAAYWAAKQNSAWDPGEVLESGPRIGTTARLRTLAVGETQLFSGSGTTTQISRIAGCFGPLKHKDGRLFTSKKELSKGVWVTRLE